MKVISGPLRNQRGGGESRQGREGVEGRLKKRARRRKVRVCPVCLMYGQVNLSSASSLWLPRGQRRVTGAWVRRFDIPCLHSLQCRFYVLVRNEILSGLFYFVSFIFSRFYILSVRLQVHIKTVVYSKSGLKTIQIIEDILSGLS